MMNTATNIEPEVKHGVQYPCLERVLCTWYALPASQPRIATWSTLPLEDPFLQRYYGAPVGRAQKHNNIIDQVKTKRATIIRLVKTKTTSTNMHTESLQRKTGKPNDM